jgi:hypothetical protein
MRAESLSCFLCHLSRDPALRNGIKWGKITALQNGVSIVEGLMSIKDPLTNSISFAIEY